MNNLSLANSCPFCHASDSKHFRASVFVGCPADAGVAGWAPPVAPRTPKAGRPVHHATTNPHRNDAGACHDVDCDEETNALEGRIFGGAV